MATSHTDKAGRRDAPVSDLIRSLFTDVALLARREAELAKIELKDKVSTVIVAVGLLAAGAMVASFAVATLIVAAVLGLAIVVPAWAATLIVAAVLVAVAVALALAGRAKLGAAAPLAPTGTLQTAQEDIAWIRRTTEQLKRSE